MMKKVFIAYSIALLMAGLYGITTARERIEALHFSKIDSRYYPPICSSDGILEDLDFYSGELPEDHPMSGICQKLKK